MFPTNLPKRAEAGLVVGGCELVRRIGRGGMAEVWVARRALGTKGSKFVAIKLMADHYVGDERYARMFRAEAELAAVLCHANIVQVFDEGEEDGRSYLVMEWVDGINRLTRGTVVALLDDEQRRLRVIAYIIGQLLHALHYAHSITSADGNPLGVVHRDVSPQNVLVSNHGEVKLTDFGVAHHALEESSGVHVKGKVRYMSPEQLSGCTREPTVDLYAVGALLHELLDGRRFRGEHEDGQELFAAVLSGRVSPLSRPIPPELDHLRLRLLEPDPKRRIQTAAEAFTLLERYPGYGDARHELTKLCGSLTGVLRPRAGLECAAARQQDELRRTLPWTGSPQPKLRLDARHPRLLRATRAPVPASPTSPPAAKVVDHADMDMPLAGGTELTPPLTRLGRMTSETDASTHAPYGSIEGGATGQEIGRQRLGPAHAALSWRSVLALGLGMGLVAAISASTAWWLTGGTEATEAARPTGADSSSATAELLQQEIGRRIGPPPPDPSPREASRDDAKPSQPARERDDQGETTAAPANPSDSVRPVATKPPPRKAKPAPNVLVKVRGGMGLDRAQVKVASRTVTVGDRRQVLVSAGRKSLKWRAHEHDTWKSGGSWRFEPGTTVMAFVTKEGLKLRTLP